MAVAVFAHELNHARDQIGDGIGEAPDAVVTAAKIVVAKIPPGVFRDLIVDVPFKMLTILRDQGIQPAIDFATEWAGFLGNLATKTKVQLGALAGVFTSDALMRAGTRLGCCWAIV